ncbi:DNA adenine methylase [Pseudomonas juntendi]|uniref:DNA adenine methylase n=1 Tax=Pseudomonas juntendi TaxID=2666183 RepID=UPI00345DF11B
MNYLGSKAKLLSFIDSVVGVCESKINRRGKVKFTDLFAGSGKVSEFYKNRFDVTANDVEFYSFVTLKNILENDSSVARSVDGYLNFMNKCLGKVGFITESYSPMGNRLFFTEENARIIDEAVDYVYEMRQLCLLDENQFYYLLGCILEAVDKVSNTVGHYTAYLKHVTPQASKRIQFEHIGLSELKNRRNNVISTDANDAMGVVKGDILYLDPPYTFNYSNFYSLLNTVLLNDKPEIKGVTGRRQDGRKSPWSNPVKAADLLDDLLERADFRFVVMSYSGDSVMSSEMVADVFASNGKYSLYTQQHQRYKSRKDADSAPMVVTEYLHVLDKKAA